MHHLMYNELDRFSVVASSLAFVGAGYELVLGLREYRKVVDARNQQGSGLSPSHNYRHFAKEAELDCFLERCATLDPPATPDWMRLAVSRFRSGRSGATCHRDPP